MPKGSREMAFPNARRPDGDDVMSLGHKRSVTQTLDLQAQSSRESLPLKGAEGLLARQLGLCQVPLNAPLLAFFAFQACKLVEKAFMGEILAGWL
jgi:hypothetical protein